MEQVLEDYHINQVYAKETYMLGYKETCVLGYKGYIFNVDMVTREEVLGREWTMDVYSRALKFHARMTIFPPPIFPIVEIKETFLIL